MENTRGRAVRIAGACLVAAALAVVPYRGWAHDYRDDGAREYRDDAYASSRHRGGYNDQYIFAATRGVSDMDAPAVVRATLFPVTLLVDFVLLPGEIIGGFFG